MGKTHLTRLAGAFLAATMALSACAQEEEPADTGAADDKADSAKLAKACDANVAISKGFNKIFSEEGPEGEGPPTPEQNKKIQEGLDKEVLPHIEEVEANAPEEIEDEIKTAGAAVRKFRQDPTFDVESDEEAAEAIEKIDQHFFDNCDYQKAEVEAADYEFKNVPSDVKSDEDLMVKFENKGKEVHEFVVLGKKDGVTDSWDDILKLDEEQGRAKTEFVGVAFAPPGKTSFGVYSFKKAGDYMAVCFIPKGTTSPDQLGGPPGAEESPGATTSPGATASPTATGKPSPKATGGPAAEEGPPHFTLGMRKEFKVG